MVKRIVWLFLVLMMVSGCTETPVVIDPTSVSYALNNLPSSTPLKTITPIIVFKSGDLISPEDLQPTGQRTLEVIAGADTGNTTPRPDQNITTTPVPGEPSTGLIPVSGDCSQPLKYITSAAIPAGIQLVFDAPVAINAPVINNAMRVNLAGQLKVTVNGNDFTNFWPGQFDSAHPERLFIVSNQIASGSNVAVDLLIGDCSFASETIKVPDTRVYTAPNTGSDGGGGGGGSSGSSHPSSNPTAAATPGPIVQTTVEVTVSTGGGGVTIEPTAGSGGGGSQDPQSTKPGKGKKKKGH